MPLSLGTRVIWIYLLAAYVLPAIAIVLTSYESLIYFDPALSLPQLLYGMLLFATVVIVAYDRSPVWRYRIAPMKPPKFALEAGVLLAIVATVAIGFTEGLARWRYSNAGLSESLSLTSLAYVVGPSIFEILLFAEIFCFADLPQFRVQRRIITFLLTIGLALTASGIGPVLVVLMALLYTMFPAQFRVLILRNDANPNQANIATKLGVIPMIGVALVCFVIAVGIGEQIKTGADSDVVTGYWGSLEPAAFFNYLIGRFSTAWVSLKVSLSNFTTVSWSEVQANLWAPIGNFLFRLDVMTGGALGIQKPFAGSLMRLNYQMITMYPLNEREGTSPGLIGGFVMAFPMPFSVIMLAGYTYFLRTMFNYLAAGFAGVPTWIGSIMAFYFLFSLFASPIDYFLIIDNGFISFAFYVGLALFIRSRFRKGLRYVQA